MSTLTLAEIQPFIDFVNGNLGLKPYTSQSLSTWAASTGKPLVASGVGYGVVLGEFPATGVVTVNGRDGDVTLDNTDVGLGNVPNVDCTNASNITTGMLPLSVIPAAALERLVHVADEAARFLLTVDDVQDGDVVQQDDTNIMYKVVDDTNLDNAAGYNEFAAGIAAAVNWSGILGVPQSVIDVAAASGVAKDMLVYLAGHWVPQTPSQVRSNLDIPVKGNWDMSPVTIDNSVVYSSYPALDADVTGSVGAPVFPNITNAGATHGMPLASGSLPNPGYVAATTSTLTSLLPPFSDTFDIPVPTVAGVQTPLLLAFSSTISQGLLQDLDGNDLPVTFPTAALTCQVHGKDAATTDSVAITIRLTHTYVSGATPTGCVLSAGMSGKASGVNFSSTTTKQDVALPTGGVRVLLYFDADTRQVGLMVDGVDLGWFVTSGSVPLTVPTTVETLGILKVGAYSGISASDPSLGETLSVTHSITLADVTETDPIGTFAEWSLPSFTVTDPVPPAGTELSNRFFAQPGGAFGGVTAETGDIVEFTGVSPYSIFVYPKADTLVRVPMLSDYATLTDLGIVQSDVTDLSDAMGLLDGRVTDIENSLTSLDNRTVREKFLSGTGRIMGASSNGSDLHSGFVAEGDAVIVTNFTDTYVGITGQFAGFPLGSVAVRHNDSWLNFAPQPGDEYVFVSRMTATGGVDAGQLIPLVFKVTYIGGNPGTNMPSLEDHGTFIASQFTSTYQDRSPLAWEASYSQYGGAFRQLGWMLHSQANGEGGQRVRYVLSTDGPPIEVNPLADEVVYIRNSTAEAVVTVNVVMPKPTDQIGDPDRTYAWILAAASRRTRVIIEGVVEANNFIVFVNQISNLGGATGAARNARVALFRYRGVQSTNPGDNGIGNLVHDSAYDSRGMVLDVWLDPSSTGSGMPQPTVRVERKDRGGKVAYESYPAGLYTESMAAPDLRVLHWESPSLSQYVPALGRAITWMVLPPPVQEGVRLLARVSNGYRDPDGPQHSVVWTTAPNETGLPAGLKTGTDTYMPVSAQYGQVMEFVCVRQSLTSYPDVTLSHDLVWSWVPPAAQNFRVAKYEETLSYWTGQWWQPDSLSTQRELTLTGSTSWGYPLTVGLDTDSLRANAEGEVVSFRVKTSDAGKFLVGLQFRNQSANTVDLPGTISRPIWAPFDIVTAYKVVNGALEFVSQEILQETVAAEVVTTPIAKDSSGVSSAIYIAGGGVGSDGWPVSTRPPVSGKYAVATHRVTVQAYSGTTRAYFKEMIVRVKHDGVNAAKVAETVVYEDKDNVTSEISVSIDVTSFFVGDGTTFLGVVGQSTVAENIRWTGRIESIYG